MFCSNCAAELPGNARFCMQCAHPINLNFQTSAATARQVFTSDEEFTKISVSPKKSNNNVLLALLVPIIGIALMCLAGVAFFRLGPTDKKASLPSPPAPSFTNIADVSQNSMKERPAKPKRVIAPVEVPAPQPQRDTVSLVNDSFPVAAGQLHSFEVVVPDGARLVGSFTTRGGSNDIYCYVVTSREFENLKNGNSFRNFYDSGKVTNGEIDLSLSPGSYRVVFSNAHSTFTNKVVTAELYLVFGN